MAAGALREVSEDLDRKFARSFPGLQLFFHDFVDLLPERGSHNGFTVNFTPFAFGFVETPPVSMFSVAIEEIRSLGALIDENTSYGHVPPEFPVPGPVAACIEEFRNGSLAAVLQKELVCLSANRCFIRVWDKLAVFPVVAVGCT